MKRRIEKDIVEKYVGSGHDQPGFYLCKINDVIGEFLNHLFYSFRFGMS